MPALRLIDQRDLDLFAELFPDEFFATKGPVTFGRSYLFDFETGEFSVDTRGSVKDTGDVETLKQAILKVLLTERFRFGIYNNYGAGIDAAVGYKNDGITGAAIKRLIREAMNRDNRILKTNSITVLPQGDKVFVEIIVTAIGGSTVRIFTELER